MVGLTLALMYIYSRIMNMPFCTHLMGLPFLSRAIPIPPYSMIVYICACRLAIALLQTKMQLLLYTETCGVQTEELGDYMLVMHVHMYISKPSTYRIARGPHMK